jgi:hypothetical protein
VRDRHNFYAEMCWDVGSRLVDGSLVSRRLSLDIFVVMFLNGLAGLPGLSRR